VFEDLRDELAHPEAIAEYVRSYNAERRRLAKESSDRERHLQHRNGELDREIDRLITNIARALISTPTTRRSMTSRPNAIASRPSSHRSRPVPRSSPCTGGE